MNQLKSLFKVLDHIFLEPLGKEVLNFKSTAAYNYFVCCKDNHKSWQSFEILLHGTVLELIRIYEKENHSKITAIGFLKWQSTVESATLKLVLQLIFTYALGIYVQRIGDRNNDIVTSDAGRYAFTDFFYAFHHPIYREIEYRDLRNKTIYPIEVRKQRYENLTFSTSSQEHKNQGGYFLLEQKIQKQKMMAPQGSVEKTTWQRISRSVDTFDKIYKNIDFQLSLTDETRSRNILLSEEIVQWRAVIRYSDYLKPTKDEQNIYNIFGDALSNDMLNFAVKTKNKRLLYWKQALCGKKLQHITYANLHVATTETESDNFSDISD